MEVFIKQTICIYTRKTGRINRCALHTLLEMSILHTHTQCRAKTEPSQITGDVAMRTEREDTAVKAQIIQTGDMELRVLVRALTSKTSLPIQGSDSQRLFLSSSSFYPLEQLHMDHWTPSCLWPADPEHTPLKGKQKGYHHPTTRPCIRTPPEVSAHNAQRNRNISHAAHGALLYLQWGYLHLLPVCALSRKTQRSEKSFLYVIIPH